ncbi:FtsX-like permease family protein [Cryptosporangium minutisporangium]|uniref:ABC3 transporter permease C-terminal domain-containing protein n=1 Tax=Cryptosporangium minutisporangium TaxID=113569 RepID=A0ABP6T4H2_9ACTN
MRPSVLLRLAVTGGRLDGLRIVLTAFGGVLATLLLLAAATVLSIEGDAPYTNGLLAQPGLRPGVTVALLLLGVPVLSFVGQCVRVGAPARDRRLADYRMSGATPGQAAAVAATETGLAAAVGTVIGFAVYLIGRVLLDRPQPPRPLPTDVLPPWWALLAIAVVVPVLGAALAALALRRSTLTPFGVVRRRPSQPPRVLPAVLFVGGTAALTSNALLLDWFGADLGLWWILLLEVVLLMVALLGLVTGGAAVSAAIGRRIASRAKSPALLLAGRRLVADPWAASRTLPAVLAAVLLGAGALTMRAVFAANWAAQEQVSRQVGEEYGPRDAFYDRAFALTQLAVWVAIVVAAGGLLIATVEQVLERRRTLAALTAQGTPTGVLARALLWQSALPLVPGVLLAAATGAIAARAVAGPGVYEQEVGGGCTPPTGVDVDAWCADPAHQAPVRTVTVELQNMIPWSGLTVLSVGAVVVTLVICALGLLLLRRATAITELRAT